MTNEVRLIDANAFYERLEDIRMEYLEEDTMSSNFAAEVIETVLDSYLKDAPTIDPESLRPKGRKERSAISKTGLMCTNCYSDVDRDAVFCKYCGAKMMEG